MSFLVILIALMFCITVRILAILWLAVRDIAWCALAWETPEAKERLRMYLGIVLHSVALYHATVTGDGIEFGCALLSSIVFACLFRHVLAADLRSPGG